MKVERARLGGSDAPPRHPARALVALLPLLALGACNKDTEEAVETTAPGGTLELDTPPPVAWAAEGALTADGTATNVESVTVAGSRTTPRCAGAPGR